MGIDLSQHCLLSVFKDSMLGAAFTRFQTLYLCKKFPEALSDRLISYGQVLYRIHCSVSLYFTFIGPCQFPTLGFVTERVRSLQYVRDIGDK